MTTPETALIDYFDNDQKFDDTWSLLHDGSNEVESYEILAYIHAAAEKVFHELENSETELENYSQFVENQIQEFEFRQKDQCFVKKELKKFLRIMKHGWKSLRKKLERTWERESMKSALLEVLNDPTLPSRTSSPARSVQSMRHVARYEPRSVSRSRDPRSESVPVYHRKRVKQKSSRQFKKQRRSPNPKPVVLTKPSNKPVSQPLTIDENRILFQKWVNLAEQKSFGKRLIDNWRDQDVLDDLELSHITEEVLLSQGLAKIQCVVLLKWKQTVLHGGSKVSSKKSVPKPQSHLYVPVRGNDSSSTGRRSPAPEHRSKRTVKKTRDPLVVLWGKFDHEESGWIKTSQVPDLVFCTFLLFRQQQINIDPTLQLPSREEIKPLVNGIVWELMKLVDLERHGFLGLVEYKALSSSLLQEWKKVCQRQESKPLVETNFNELEEDNAENKFEDASSDGNAETSINTTFSEDDHKLQHIDVQTKKSTGFESGLRTQLLKDPTLGTDLMCRVVRECDTWNKNKGSTSDLLSAIKEHLNLTEKKLNMIEEISI